MDIKFNKITVHNFLSFGHSEIELSNKNYCIVKGENHYKLDNALSNGSGKSSIWSAISYCLTGETIQGLSSNLKNLNIDENLCYVILEFTVDNNNYILTRFNKPKSDLKIIVNGEDKSGKGVRESEIILSNYLPDLSHDLIASTIIIGQGMPTKFSSFSPSGRKELLEKLTKSDFMIEDMKARISNRLKILSDNINIKNQELAVQTVLKTATLKNLDKQNQQLESYKNQPDFDNLIKAYQADLDTINYKLNLLTVDLKGINGIIDTMSTNVMNISKDKYNELDKLKIEYDASVKPLNEKLNELLVDKKTTEKSIKDIDNIQEFCPTCKQKLVNVHKPDSTSLKEHLAELNNLISDTQDTLNILGTSYKDNCANIDKVYSNKLNDYETDLKHFKSSKLDLETNITSKSKQCENLNIEIAKLITQKDTFIANKQHLEDEIKSLNLELTNLDQVIKDINSNIDKYTDHLNIVKKMDSLVKRDFRGYLLKDIVEYLNNKSKEYCQLVFNTTELEIYLDGNSLDVSYCGKMIDNLSGGERQRIDLIIQLAIRDMLCRYMNYNSNIIVLDEIFDNLDKLATDKILDLITKELYNVGSVYIISHHADELNIPYDTELVVIKNEQGISEVV